MRMMTGSFKRLFVELGLLNGPPFSAKRHPRVGDGGRYYETTEGECLCADSFLIGTSHLTMIDRRYWPGAW